MTNKTLSELIGSYDCSTQDDYNNALKEVMQDIALLGLWRAKFFEKAAFYGGTALRILYHLDRFSEDLDFILLSPNEDFDLTPYLSALTKEISSFGLFVEVKEKIKTKESMIKSAFLKANTREHVIQIGAPDEVSKLFQLEETTKIKLEIDTNPSSGFDTESKGVFSPIPFFIKTLDLPSLFAGKLHAVLFREWGNRIKGRDWFDMLWFVQKKIKVNYQFLENKMRQTGHYETKEPLTPEILQGLLKRKIDSLDIDRAKEDIIRFIQDKRLIEGWSSELFIDCAERITFCK